MEYTVSVQLDDIDETDYLETVKDMMFKVLDKYANDIFIGKNPETFIMDEIAKNLITNYIDYILVFPDEFKFGSYAIRTNVENTFWDLLENQLEKAIEQYFDKSDNTIIHYDKTTDMGILQDAGYDSWEHFIKNIEDSYYVLYKNATTIYYMEYINHNYPIPIESPLFMILYEYMFDNKNLYCNPIEVLEKPSSYSVNRRWETYSHRSVLKKDEEALILDSLKYTENKCLFLLEKNDTKAKQLFIEYYNSMINNLNIQINNNKNIIKSINELTIEEKTP